MPVVELRRPADGGRRRAGRGGLMTTSSGASYAPEPIPAPVAEPAELSMPARQGARLLTP
ncbi:hypothetical protein GCM10027059_13530 [Myceligenerans halotolerans]